MKIYGYGILRPFLDKMIERMTIIDKLFLIGIVVIVIARIIPISTTPIEPIPTIPDGVFGYGASYKAVQNTLLSATNGIKALVFIIACYIIAKVGEFTNSKNKDDDSHEPDY